MTVRWRCVACTLSPKFTYRFRGVQGTFRILSFGKLQKKIQTLVKLPVDFVVLCVCVRSVCWWSAGDYFVVIGELAGEEIVDDSHVGTTTIFVGRFLWLFACFRWDWIAPWRHFPIQLSCVMWVCVKELASETNCVLLQRHNQVVVPICIRRFRILPFSSWVGDVRCIGGFRLVSVCGFFCYWSALGVPTFSTGIVAVFRKGQSLLAPSYVMPTSAILVIRNRRRVLWFRLIENLGREKIGRKQEKEVHLQLCDRLMRVAFHVWPHLKQQKSQEMAVPDGRIIIIRQQRCCLWIFCRLVAI